MEILQVAKYGQNCYSELLQDFHNFKDYLEKILKSLEIQINEFIIYNSDQFSFSSEAFQHIEKEFNIDKLVYEMRRNAEIAENLIKNNMKENKYFEEFKTSTQYMFNSIKQIIEEYFKNNVFEFQQVNLSNELRHPGILTVNENQVVRDICSNGRWLIQTILKKETQIIQYTSSIKFILDGSDIIFGIAPFEMIEKNKFELPHAISNSYFLRQDGTHYGFGLSEVEQEFSNPNFTAKRQDIVKLSYSSLKCLMIIQNLTRGISEQFEIPAIPKRWCFIIGFRFHNEKITLQN